MYNDVLPDQNYGSSPTVTVSNYVVSQATSQVAVTAAVSNVQVYGNQLTFTATVTAANPGLDPNPPADVNLAGTVTFSDSLSGSLGAGTFVAPNKWTFTTSATQFAAGTHTITATYSGDTNLTGPVSSTLASYVIAPAATSVSTPTSTNNPSVYGQPTTLSATVTGAGTGTPGNPTTGTVTFYDGTTALGTVDFVGQQHGDLDDQPAGPADEREQHGAPHHRRLTRRRLPTLTSRPTRRAACRRR